MMDPNGVPGGMLPNLGSGMLGLEMQQQHQHFVSFATKQPNSYFFGSKGKQQQQQLPPPTTSDEDDQVAADDGASGDTSCGGKQRAASPWQRMKWTDSMVRLLIMMVYYVGDDGGVGAAAVEASEKKKGGSSGMLQKKGKWKSVSRAMMEKSFFVSPQQCEDKFNDLNKRYKRVNDILGKGTACRVVENQSLLESMDHISPKTKEEVRKLLNSKHLFFREMCAYHNSGAAAAAAVAGAGYPEVDSSHHNQHEQQRCLHSTDNAATMTACARDEGRDVEEEDEDDDDYDDDDEEDDEEIEHEEEKGQGICTSSKRQRMSPASPSMVQQLKFKVKGMMQDGTKCAWEQRQWLWNQVLMLEEQRVGYQCQALELEKQRFKWLKFSGKKVREMEKMKLDNERMRLENERMLLLLRQKEIELDIQPGRHSDPSITG